MKKRIATLLFLGLCGCSDTSPKTPAPDKPAGQQTVRDDEVNELTLVLKDGNASKREWAVKRLEAIGREQPQRASAAMRALLQAVEDPKNDVAENATYAVAELGEENAEAAKLALPALVRVMKDAKRDLAVRVGATRALGEIGERQPQLPEVKATVEPLVGALKDKAQPMRSTAVWSLREIGLKNPSAVQVALPALKEVAAADESNDVRKEATSVLQKIKAEP